jgi:hypothetical protein
VIRTSISGSVTKWSLNDPFVTDPARQWADPLRNGRAERPEDLLMAWMPPRDGAPGPGQSRRRDGWDRGSRRRRRLSPRRAHSDPGPHSIRTPLATGTRTSRGPSWRRSPSTALRPAPRDPPPPGPARHDGGHIQPGSSSQGTPVIQEHRRAHDQHQVVERQRLR